MALDKEHLDTEKDDPNNSVHGKLMQSYSNNTEKPGKDPEDPEYPFDLKVEIYIKKHGFKGRSSGSPVKRYRADVRKCCLYACVVFFILVLAAIGIFLAIYFTRKDKAEVRTKNGLLKGRVALSPQGTEVEEFLGIPFAKPPVGDLRYADPVPYGDFPSGGYDATEFKYACIQYLDTTFGDFEGSDMWNAKNKLSEDCLYLNIWVPRPFRTGRAVMVWIYGGGFYSGSNSLWVYDGKALADHTDVIVASFNYRVGTFGFLGTGDGRIPGNFGLKDQRVAMQWIKDNIEAFGGDPELITAFGESSGAASVGYHMMSAESKDLFKRSIFESGSPDSHWSFMSVQQAQQRSRAFFQSVNCPDDDDVLECLRKLDAMDILSKEWVDLNFLVFPWVPTVDGDFLTDTPHNLLKAGKFVLKDSLLGINKDEGTFWNLYAVEGLSKDGPSLLTHPMYRSGVDVIDWDLSNETRERVKEMYTPLNKSDMAANRDALDDVCGDRSFVCPTAELTDHFVKSGIKTYFYYLTHRASIEVWPPWMGVIHGAEIQWIFGMAMNKSRGYSSEEVWFAKTVMEYWANFAKYGDPNGPTLPYWPQYTQKNPAYMEMKGPYDMFPSYDGPVKSYYCQLWNDINVRINQGLELR